MKRNTIYLPNAKKSKILYACRRHEIFATLSLVARVAELVDAPDLGSGAFGREGSTPFARTIFKPLFFSVLVIPSLKEKS